MEIDCAAAVDRRLNVFNYRPVQGFPPSAGRYNQLTTLLGVILFPAVGCNSRQEQEIDLHNKIVIIIIIIIRIFRVS